MARKLRVQYEGAIYHVTARGVERRVIFDDDRDREHFLKQLEDGVEVYGVRLYLYCLMRNHFHLLVETPAGNLPAFMQKIETAHTVFYNIRHDRTGHLLQGRYDAKLVDGDEYLDRLSRYVHLNPVYTGNNAKKPLESRLRLLREYRWSSFRGYAGLARQHEFVDEGALLKMAGGRSESARRRNYKKFVEAGLANDDEEFVNVLEKGKWGIGGETFQAGIRDMHMDMAQKARRPEDVSLRRVESRHKPEKVLSAVCDAFGGSLEDIKKRSYGSLVRAVAARMLMKYSGMNQRDAGVYLKIGSGAAVCQQLKRLKGSVDKRLEHEMSKVESELGQ